MHKNLWLTLYTLLEKKFKAKTNLRLRFFFSFFLMKV